MARVEIGNDSLAAAFRTMDGPVRKMKIDREGESFVIDGGRLTLHMAAPDALPADLRPE